jgi:hypothetical protein
MIEKNPEEATELALLFHNTYEKLAPSFGYETKLDTRKFDFKSNNGKLMIAVCDEILKWQAERMYSDEEVENIAKFAYTMGRNNILIGVFNKWFEQLKKEISYESK